MRQINKIIFHCTASDNPGQNVDSVRRYHKFTKGWSDIGYHYLITKDGTIQEGRPLEKVGAHCRGQNTGSVGVCFEGLHDFTTAQMQAIHDVIKTIEKRVGNKLQLTSHNEFSSKTCPNFNLENFMNGKITVIKRYD